MNIVLNGSAHAVDADTTLERLIRAEALPERGIAIAVNQQVVRSVEWPDHVLDEGDVVDVVTALQGG